MPFDPTQFYLLASELGANSGEAHLRTAVGRAYYSVFLQARAKLGIRGTKRVHTKVIVALKGRDRAAGDQLSKLETLRGLADYELDITDSINRDWPRNWQMAQAFVQHLQRRLSLIP